MATKKRIVRKTATLTPPAVKSTAYEVWLAGLGALVVAQRQGRKQYQALVQQGQALEKRVRKLAATPIAETKQSVIDTAQEMTERAQSALQGVQKTVADQVERVVGQRERHRFDVEVVAEEHRDVVAPPRVHRQPAAAQIRVVDDVVVDERRGVNELDDGGVQNRAVAGVAHEARGHQEHRRTDALAAARADVLADLRDQRDLRLDVACELLVDLLQVGADRLEDLRQGR